MIATNYFSIVRGLTDTYMTILIIKFYMTTVRCMSKHICQISVSCQLSSGCSLTDVRCQRGGAVDGQTNYLTKILREMNDK